MRILITNDDGIRAHSLECVVQWAKKLGEVEIFAPKVEQSAKSHAIELYKPFEVLKVEREDGLLIHGGKPLAGGLVDGAKDHRIVMSAAVAATVCEGEVIITDAQAADKSFPAFFKTAIRR